jgi:hypothetical protein
VASSSASVSSVQMPTAPDCCRWSLVARKNDGWGCNALVRFHAKISHALRRRCVQLRLGLLCTYANQHRSPSPMVPPRRPHGRRPTRPHAHRSRVLQADAAVHHRCVPLHYQGLTQPPASLSPATPPSFPMRIPHLASLLWRGLCSAHPPLPPEAHQAFIVHRGSNSCHRLCSPNP